MELTETERRFVQQHTYARLATVSRGGVPQVKPVGVVYNADLGTIDIFGINMGGSAKFRNVQDHPQVALVVDDATGEGPEGTRFLEIRGRAEALTRQAVPDPHLSPEIIRVHPNRTVAYNVDSSQTGLHTRTAPGDDQDPAWPRQPTGA
jgi:pyridoxamine 5'-phosphate oxidase family protein